MTDAAAGQGAGRISWRPSGFWPAPLALYLWLAILILAPNALLVGVSFLKASGGLVVFEPTLANFRKLLLSESVWVLLVRTIATAAGSAVIAALIAFPMAYYASRIMRRGKTAAMILIVIPLWISLLMRVFAWRLILGETGVLNSFLVSSGLLETPSTAFLYTPFAVLLTFVYVAIPYVFVAAYAALERIPHNLIEASQDSGAGPIRTFLNVVWPLARPGTVIGIVLAFLLAVGDYVTPSMVGGLDGTMLGMVISSQFGLAGNWPYGAALALMLVVVVALLLALTLPFMRSPGILTGEADGAPVPAPQDKSIGGTLRGWLAFGAFCLPYIFLYAPLAIIVVFSFNASKLQAFPLSGFTWEWYAALGENGAMLAALRRSLYVGALVLLISTVVGTGFALALAFLKFRGGRIVEQLLALPVAIPGVVLGISLVLVAQILAIPAGVPRVVIGHATFVMPVVMMIVLARLRRLDPSLAEASMDLGAGRVRTLIFVLLPLIRGAIIGGALLGFTLSVDEVVVTLFLTGTEPTLPVWVWNQMRFGFTPSVNAIFTCIGIFTLLLILAAQYLVGGSGLAGAKRGRDGAA